MRLSVHQTGKNGSNDPRGAVNYIQQTDQEYISIYIALGTI